MTLEIIPIDCGAVTGVERSGQQYMTGFGEKIEARVITWLIRGGQRTILVDSGSGTPDLVERTFGRTLRQTPDQRPEAGLKAAGVSAEEIDILVQTHLHWDHCLSLHDNLYPNAEIYLQREELRYAASPYPVQRALYDADLIATFVPHFGRRRNFKLLCGDARIAPGVRLLLTPGHSPGLQAVLVETDSGRIAIASDNVPFYESWRGPTADDWIPPGIHVSLDDCYASNARLAAAADLVLPSHDARVLEHEIYR